MQKKAHIPHYLISSSLPPSFQHAQTCPDRQEGKSLHMAGQDGASWITMLTLYVQGTQHVSYKWCWWGREGKTNRVKTVAWLERERQRDRDTMMGQRPADGRTNRGIYEYGCVYMNARWGASCCLLARARFARLVTGFNWQRKQSHRILW